MTQAKDPQGELNSEDPVEEPVKDQGDVVEPANADTAVVSHEETTTVDEAEDAEDASNSLGESAPESDESLAHTTDYEVVPDDTRETTVADDLSTESYGHVDGTEYTEHDETYDGETAFDQEQEEEDNPKDKRAVRFALVGLAVGIFVGFCCNYAVTGVQDLIRTANTTVITAAVDECKLNDKDGVTVSDSGKRLTIDTKGKDDESGATGPNAVCLVQTLQVPEDVLQKLDSTEAGSERQTTEWDKRELSWEFTDNSGINIEYVIKS